MYLPMKYKPKDEGILLTGYDSFCIGETLECGQCFRFTKLTEDKYAVIAFRKVLYIEQEKMDQIYFYPCSMAEFEKIWMGYFDLNRDYAAIKKKLVENDPVMAQAVDYAGGIRILNQDPWECMLSFIISQNNHIPRIKLIIKNISELYGDPLGDGYYAFPEPEALKETAIGDFMSCNAGFRGKYLVDAVDKVLSGVLNMAEMNLLETDALKERLQLVYGIGPKVADCIMLFSWGRREVFPTDVWVKRIMQQFYFQGKETTIKEIHRYAGEKWGGLAGYAQQYLFHFARKEKIG